MAFSLHTLEALAAWCRDSTELAQQRRAARTTFFAEDDPRPVEYLPGTGDKDSRERRFAGYFMFDWHLPDGGLPAIVAARRLLKGRELEDGCSAIEGQRFVFAAITSVIGRSVFLQLGKERFEVRHPQWAALMERGLSVHARILPASKHYWIPGPGWTALGIKLTPAAVEHLPTMQCSALDLERTFQGRTAPDDPPKQPRFEDDSLAAAVARITEWAKDHGHPRLVMTGGQWTKLVLRYLEAGKASEFHHDVINRGDEFRDVDEINELAALASNIWNNTPQPDRGGKSANQLMRERG